MQFRINLATRTYINKKRLNGALAAILTVLLFLLLVQIKIVSHNAEKIARFSAMRATQESLLKKKAPGVSEKDFAKISADVKFANNIIYRKTFDWIGLLNRLEGVIPEGSTLTSVEPDSKEQTLRLAGVSQNFRSLRNLMENLENSNSFSNIYLYRQDELKTGDNPKAISFSITCRFSL